MGLLEQLLERLNQLNARLDALEGAASLTVDNTQDTTVITGQVVESTTAGTGEGIELDKDGIPWDERIHAGTQTKTAKQTWTRKKGITDELYDSVIAELKAKHGGEQTQTETTAPTPPVKPGVPTKPGAPVKPGVPTKPGAPVVTGLDKKQAIEIINKLTSPEYGATFDDVLVVLKKYGTDTFDGLQISQYAAVKADVESWFDWATLVKDTIDELNKMGEGTEYADDIKTAIEAYIANAGGKDSKPGSVPIDGLSVLSGELDAYASSWEEYFKG